MDDWNGNCTSEGVGNFFIKSFKYLLAGFLLAFIFSLKSFGAAAPAEVEGTVKADTVWSGQVLVVGDVLVPEGVTLRVEPGTHISFIKSESSKIEPMFLSMGTELMVRGKLLVEGEKDRPVVFDAAPQDEDGNVIKPGRGDWGGIIFDGRSAEGSVVRDAKITMAETAVSMYGSSPSLESCTLVDNKYGVICMGGSRPRLADCRVEGGVFGVLSGKGSSPVLTGTAVKGNEKDFLTRE